MLPAEREHVLADGSYLAEVGVVSHEELHVDEVVCSFPAVEAGASVEFLCYLVGGGEEGRRGGRGKSEVSKKESGFFSENKVGFPGFPDFITSYFDGESEESLIIEAEMEVESLHDVMVGEKVEVGEPVLFYCRSVSVVTGSQVRSKVAKIVVEGNIFGAGNVAI